MASVENTKETVAILQRNKSVIEERLEFYCTSEESHRNNPQVKRVAHEWAVKLDLIDDILASLEGNFSNLRVI